MSTSKDKIQQSQYRVTKNVYPYLAAILFRMRLVEDPEAPTLSVTENLLVRYNPDHVAGLNSKQVNAEIVHESLHALLRHFSRAKALGLTTKEEYERWNIAGDFEINSMMASDKSPEIEMDNTWLLPEPFGFPPMLTAEEYYHLLQQPQKGKPMPKPGNGPGKGQCGGIAGSPQPGDQEAMEGESADDGEAVGPTKYEMEATAKAVASLLGNKPGNLAGTLAKKLGTLAQTPQIRWQDLLRRYLVDAYERTSGNELRTYRRGHVYQATLDDLGSGILPYQEDYKIDVAILIDTSGSMFGLYEKAFSEINNIIKDLEASSLVVFQADMSVRRSEEVSDASDLEVSGGGGTDMSFAISQVLSNPQVSMLVVVTDCYTGWPDASEIYKPTIVCGIGAAPPPPPEYLPFVQVKD